MKSIAALLPLLLGVAATAHASDRPEPVDHRPVPVHHRTLEVQGVDVFYREAGSPQAPTVLLLHGFAASSYMFRDLIPQLAQRYHVLAPDPSLIAPEPWQLAAAAIERIGVEPQVELLADYGSNVRQYAQLHAYFRAHQPPTLAIWGRNDPFFLPAGAEAFKRDNPEAQVRFLDTGHLALETHGDEIAQAMLAFLDRHL